MTNEGEIVGGTIYLTLRRKGWLQQTQEAPSKPQKSPKPNALSVSAGPWRPARLRQLTFPGLSDSHRPRLWPGSECLPFLVTLHYIPVSPPGVQLFLYLPRKEFVIPSGNGSVVGVRLALLAAGSESDHIQTWKDAQSCVGHDATVPLPTRLGGGFNSLGPSSLLVTTKQKSPWLQWFKVWVSKL